MATVMPRTSHPQISFADLEFLRQGIQLDPILQAIAKLLNKRRAKPQQRSA
jgi:hypothetical protein